MARLPDHCLSVPGCRAPRLRYAGYCAEHGHVDIPPTPPCVAPIRCHCLLCLGADRAMLGPYDGPETIRIRIATARGLTVVPPVTE